MIGRLEVRDVVALAQTTEELGEKFYRELGRRFADNANFRELFEQLAREELDHQAQFSALMEMASPGRHEVDEELLEHLRALAISQHFSLSRGPFRDVDRIDNEIDGLQVALQFERSTLALFEALRDAMGADSILDALVDTERRHVLRILHVIATLARARGELPEWARDRDDPAG